MYAAASLAYGLPSIRAWAPPYAMPATFWQNSSSASACSCSSPTANPTTATAMKAVMVAKIPVMPYSRRASAACILFASPSTRKPGSYLPHIFGAQGYFLLRHPAELPQRLPLLYARMTAPFR